MTEIPQEIADKLAALEREFDTNEEKNNADRNIITDYERTIAARDRRQDELIAEIRVIKDLNNIWIESIKRGDINYIEIPVGAVVSLAPEVPPPVEEPRTFPPTTAERVLKLFEETGRPMSSNEIHAAIGGSSSLNTVQTWMSTMKKNSVVAHDKVAHVFWPSAWGTWRVPRDRMTADLSALEDAP